MVVEWLERFAKDQEALGLIPVNSNIILEKQPFYSQHTMIIEWRLNSLSCGDWDKN